MTNSQILFLDKMRKKGTILDFLTTRFIAEKFSAIKRVVKKSKMVPFFEGFGGGGGNKKNFPGIPKFGGIKIAGKVDFHLLQF